MSITTTTLAAVIDSMTTVIRDLVPTRAANKRFDRVSRRHDLRTNAVAGAGEGILRKFEIVRVGMREDPLVLDPSASLLVRDLEVLVAYPTKLGDIYGRELREDLEDTMDADAHQIWSAFYDTANVVVGATYIPEVGEPDRSHDHVWFQPVIVKVHWYQTTTYT